MTERILYVDMVGGVAGDMFMAALLDIGGSVESIRSSLKSLALDKVSLETYDVFPAGLRARRVDVHIDGVLADTHHKHLSEHEHTHHHEHRHKHSHTHHRPYRMIRSMLQESGLAEPVVQRAQKAFKLLAQAESLSHGIDIEEVVFHEVGSDDAIADIVGCCVLLHELNFDRIVVSAFPWDRD